MVSGTWARKARLPGCVAFLALLLAGCSGGVDNTNGSAQPSLSFVEPAQGESLPLATPAAVIVQVLQPSQNFIQPGLFPEPNKPVALSTTSGNLSAERSTACSYTASAPAKSLQLSTDGNGEALAYLCNEGSQGAGGTVLTATAENGTLSTARALVFIATMPAKISLQASPSTILASGTSDVTTVVLDRFQNPVPNQRVDFVLTDPSGGTLSSPSAETNIAGMASVVYRPNPHFDSKTNVDVSIGADVAGTSVSTAGSAQITVLGTALSIHLGPGVQISSPSSDTYAVHFGVVVADPLGNPAPNLTVDLKIQSTAYQKGQWTLVCGGGGSSCPPGAPAWVVNYSISPSDPDYNSPPRGQAGNFLDQGFGCRTEDPDDTGIYTPAKDYNHNGKLDPGQPASVPATVQLNSVGAASFAVTYPKDVAQWVQSAVFAKLDGLETDVVFVLPIAAADIDNPSVPPPGQLSPYGQADNCADPH
jgi:adhesin/invasin